MRICARCDQTFTPKRIDSFYCSNACRKSASALRSFNRHIAGKPKVCIQCNSKYTPTRAKQKYCSVTCSAESRRRFFTIPDCLEDPDRKIDKNIGYVRIYCPMHPEANTRGYVYEHRVIAEETLGRRLKKGEVVHHKNRKRWDNCPKNLQVMSSLKEHRLLHAKEDRENARVV